MTDEGLSDTTEPSPLEENECVVTEEFAAIPQLSNFTNSCIESTTSTTLHQRRYDIYERLNKCVEKCRKRFAGRKELATDVDEGIVELCDIIEESFQYGLKQHQPKFVVSAALLFQNMQEIVTGGSPMNSWINNSDVQFWDFCQRFLTPHEKHYYEQLSNVWTRKGRGRAFIRNTLNEHSLQRYVLTWLAERDDLNSFYTHWSLLMDEKMSSGLAELIKSLDDVLFALNVNKTELNAAPKSSTVAHNAATAERKEEPIIYAPEPIKVASRIKGKVKAIERPIVSLTDSGKPFKQVPEDQKPNDLCSVITVEEFRQAVQDLYTPVSNTPPDDIEKYLKANSTNTYHVIDSTSSTSSLQDAESDSSSQYSKSPKSQTLNAAETHLTNDCNNEQHSLLEQQLKEANELCSTLNTRVAKLKLENHQLTRRLKKYFLESGIDPSSSFATNFLITIPQVRLSTSGGHYIYDIHITMRQNLEHWSLWRRYNDFNKLHQSLIKTHPAVMSVEFPPKKRFGNKNLRFVEERRQQLQIYLLNLVETLPQLEACKNKTELQKVFPFLRER